MDKLKNVKAASSDKAKVAAWLDSIGEHDEACRKEVFEQCAKDKEAREYYVKRSQNLL